MMYQQGGSRGTENQFQAHGLSSHVAVLLIAGRSWFREDGGSVPDRVKRCGSGLTVMVLRRDSGWGGPSLRGSLQLTQSA